MLGSLLGGLLGGGGGGSSSYYSVDKSVSSGAGTYNLNNDVPSNVNWTALGIVAAVVVILGGVFLLLRKRL